MRHQTQTIIVSHHFELQCSGQYSYYFVQAREQMNHDPEKLLTAIKNTVISRYASLLNQHFIDVKPTLNPRTTMFEMYVYEEEKMEQQEDSTEIQQKMKEQILYELNNHLYERESLALQMEMFTLDQAIKVQQNQIQMLKIQLEGQGRNKITELQDLKTNMTKKHLISMDNYFQQQQSSRNNLLKESIKQTTSSKSKLNLFPCVRVQVTPQAFFPKNICKLKEPIVIQKDNKQSHYQQKPQKALHQSDKHIKTRIIFKKQAGTFKDEQYDQPAINLYNTQKKDHHLKGIEQQIDFLSRAWKTAKQNNRKDLSTKYKKELMKLLQTFWATAKS